MLRTRRSIRISTKLVTYFKTSTRAKHQNIIRFSLSLSHTHTHNTMTSRNKNNQDIINPISAPNLSLCNLINITTNIHRLTIHITSDIVDSNSKDGSNSSGSSNSNSSYSSNSYSNSGRNGGFTNFFFLSLVIDKHYLTFKYIPCSTANTNIDTNSSEKHQVRGLPNHTSNTCLVIRYVIPNCTWLDTYRVIAYRSTQKAQVYLPSISYSQLKCQIYTTLIPYILERASTLLEWKASPVVNSHVTSFTIFP